MYQSLFYLTDRPNSLFFRLHCHYIMFCIFRARSKENSIVSTRSFNRYSWRTCRQFSWRFERSRIQTASFLQFRWYMQWRYQSSGQNGWFK